jgi:thymidylate kinase
MTTVAIIGADGAGKSTVARALEGSMPLPTKYIYMGANIESANIALPTSRLILYVKRRSFRRVAKRGGITDPTFLSTHHSAHRSVKYGPVAAVFRTANRLAEAYFRQLVSLVYELRGFIVVHDRDFLSDTWHVTGQSRLNDRTYHWILTHLCPRPDLVVFLDAPVDVLFARKGEGSLDYLGQRRNAYDSLSLTTRGFVRVDASQPLEDVVAEVSRLVLAARNAPNAR